MKYLVVILFLSSFSFADAPQGSWELLQVQCVNKDKVLTTDSFYYFRHRPLSLNLSSNQSFQVRGGLVHLCHFDGIGEYKVSQDQITLELQAGCLNNSSMDRDKASRDLQAELSFKWEIKNESLLLTEPGSTRTQYCGPHNQVRWVYTQY